MRQVFNKIMSVLMAVVVLLSTLSFTIDMHYCGDTLIEMAVFKKVKGCGMTMEPSIEDCVLTKKNCCNDKQLVVDGQDELQLSADKITFEKQLVLASFVHSYINLFEGVETQETSYKDYTPPLVIREIYKIDETYLI